jgi:hypothetical protein
MGLPQVSSACLAEEVATSLGTFVQSAPKIAGICNYELNSLAGEEELGKCMHTHKPNSEKSKVPKLSKESLISNKDGKSTIQNLKIESVEQIDRLSVSAGQIMQKPTSRTVGFQLRALAPRVDCFGENGYSPTGVSESHVKKRLLSPLNVTLLADHFKGDHLDNGSEFYQSSSETGDDCSNAQETTQKKASSPRLPLSPLGKKSCKDKNLGECRDFDTVLSDSNLFTPDNILDMNEYWTYHASFPPQHAKLCASVSRLPIRRSLVGSFEESLLSGRLPSEKVSHVGLIRIYYESLLIGIIGVMFLLFNSYLTTFNIAENRRLSCYAECNWRKFLTSITKISICSNQCRWRQIPTLLFID